MANARLAIVEPNNYLEKGVKIEEAALPLRLSAAEIRDAVNTQAGIQVPVLVAEQVPPAVEPLVEAQVPPLVAAEVPPLLGTQVPPLVAAEVPPLLGTQVPPLVATAVPPVVAPLVQAQVPPLVQAQVPPLVQAQVPPLVASALATDPTPATAAANAVATAAANADLVKGTDSRIPKNDPINTPAYTVRDTNGRLSDIELGPDGHFSDRVLALWASRLHTERMPQSDPNPAFAFSLRDSENRQSDIELGFDGHITDRVLSLWRARLNIPTTYTLPALQYCVELTGSSPARKLYRNSLTTGQRVLVTAANDPRDATVDRDGNILFTDNEGQKVYTAAGLLVPRFPTLHHALWGDSMTYSQNVYPNRLAANLSVTAYNGGIGSQTSTEIAIRAGAIVPLVTLTGNSIPAETTATAATITPTGEYGAATTTGKWTYTGTLAGIPGTLDFDRPSKTWSFSRTTSGTATAVPAGTPFLITTPTYKDSVSVFWGGRNNLYAPTTGSWRLANVIRDARAFVETRSPFTKRLIIMGQINGTNEGKAANGSIYQDTVRVNAELAADPVTGPYYYDIRRSFIDNGMARESLTPTSQDLAAIADDAPPPSLMNVALDHPSDSVGYLAVADLVTDRIISKGWTL